MAEILVMSHGTDGDVLPFIRIASYLHKYGHKVTIFTHCYYEKKVKDAHLNFEAIDNEEGYHQLMECMNGDIDSVSNKEAIFNYRKKIESIEKRIYELSKLEGYCKDRDRDIVIIARARSSVSSLLASEMYNIPLISIFMAPYDAISMIYFDEIYGKEFLPDMNILRAKVGLQPIDSLTSWHASPIHQLGLWPEWFSQDTLDQWPAKIKPVGFPINHQGEVDHEIPEEVRGILEDRPILITGGTSRLLKDEFYPACVEAFANIDRSVILLCKYEELIPSKLPENIRWFKYLPLDSIMPYLSVIVHHGGMGSLGGALRCGIPQLVLGHFVDRPYNASRLKDIGVAEFLPPARWNPQYMQQALGRLMRPEVKETCLYYSQMFSLHNAFVNICDIVECQLVQALDLQ